MKKSQRIKTLVELKQNQEKSALQSLGDSQTRRQEMLQQLQHLQQYREDYLQKYQKQGEAGTSARRMLDFRAFISKIDSAISEQQQALDAAEQELLRRRKAWEQANRKTKSLTKVHEAALCEEQQYENKQEQSAMDERASRITRPELG